jgi:multicomponent Na+:H+ antiporter subunit C
MMHLPEMVAAWLFVVGLYGIATSRHLVHAILSLGIVQSSTYVLLLAVGYRLPPATAPIFDTTTPQTLPAVDPVVQALALTDIVVGAAVMALLLAITIQIHQRTGKLDPHHIQPLRPFR